MIILVMELILLRMIIINMAGMGKVKQFDFRIIGLFLFIGLIAGSLFANIYCSDNVSELGVFNYEFIEKMQNMNIESQKLFQYVLMERMKIWLLLFLLAFTGIGGLIYFAYILSFGFMLGLSCSTMVMIHGFMGTIYFSFLCLISQLIYFGAVMTGMFAGIGYHRRKGGFPNIILIVLTAVLLLVLSAFTETIFNLYFIKNFYN